MKLPCVGLLSWSLPCRERIKIRVTPPNKPVQMVDASPHGVSCVASSSRCCNISGFSSPVPPMTAIMGSLATAAAPLQLELFPFIFFLKRHSSWVTSSPHHHIYKWKFPHRNSRLFISSFLHNKPIVSRLDIITHMYVSWWRPKQDMIMTHNSLIFISPIA